MMYELMTMVTALPCLNSAAAVLEWCGRTATGKSVQQEPRSQSVQSVTQAVQDGWSLVSGPVLITVDGETPQLAWKWFLSRSSPWQ